MAAHRRTAARSGRRRGLALAAGVAGAVLAASITGVGAADVPTPLERTAAPLAAVAGEVLVQGTPCSATARACVDLDGHTAWLMRDGEIVRGPVRFVDGDAADPTPRGTFTVEWKAEQYTSREYGIPMPYSVFFAPGGIAFHQGDLGTSSAGCVKLEPEDAVAFFDYLRVGDEEQVR